MGVNYCPACGDYYEALHACKGPSCPRCGKTGAALHVSSVNGYTICECGHAWRPTGTEARPMRDISDRVVEFLDAVQPRVCELLDSINGGIAWLRSLSPGSKRAIKEALVGNVPLVPADAVAKPPADAQFAGEWRADGVEVAP